MLEAIFIREFGVEEGYVLIEGEALLLDVSQVDFFEEAYLIEAKDFFNLVKCNFLG